MILHLDKFLALIHGLLLHRRGCLSLELLLDPSTDVEQLILLELKRVLRNEQVATLFRVSFEGSLLT